MNLVTGVRKCACEDEEFRGLVDDFIQRNIDKIINNKHFYGLPDLKVEIIGILYSALYDILFFLKYIFHQRYM